MQTLEIAPVKKLDALVECPKSKGFTNRALVIAALAGGTSVLSNALLSDDTLHMINGLRGFGAKITVSGSALTVKGVNGKPKTPRGTVYAGNSGTASRFLMAVAALDGKAVIDGDARLRERPVTDLAEALKSLGVFVQTSKGFLPVTIRGGALNAGKIVMSGKTSSQFLSALLMVAPYALGDIAIEVSDELTSKPFVDMTISVMRAFGAEASHVSHKIFKVKSGKGYAATNYAIEGDAANASYFFAAAAITGGKVRVTAINPSSLQGEMGFVGLLQRMGCSVIKGNDWIEVTGGKLSGLSVDMNSMPDVVQTLAVLAAFADTPTSITNIANLRLKETDRIAALATELRKIGAEVDEFKDGIKIIPKTLRPAAISTYNDHRMAMSFAVAGLAIPGVKIENPGCVSKTFPEFFSALWKMSRPARNIVLIGYRCSGKSCIAAFLGKSLGRQVIETDMIVEKDAGMPIVDLVNKRGWKYFRKIESKAVRKAAGKQGAIIATGGGTVMNPESATRLKKSGVIVYLKADIVTIRRRLKENPGRPPIKGSDAIEEVSGVLKERGPVYEKLADFVIDTSKAKIAESAGLIISKLNDAGVI